MKTAKYQLKLLKLKEVKFSDEKDIFQLNLRP